MCIRAARLRFGVAHRNLGTYKNENMLYLPGRHDPDLELRIEIRRLEHCCAILLQVCLFVYVCLYIGLFSLHLDIEGFFPVCSSLLSIYQCLYISVSFVRLSRHRRLECRYVYMFVYRTLLW